MTKVKLPVRRTLSDVRMMIKGKDATVVLNGTGMDLKVTHTKEHWTEMLNAAVIDNTIRLTIKLSSDDIATLRSGLNPEEIEAEVEVE